VNLFTIETFKDGEIIAQTGDYNPKFILIKTGRAHVWHHPKTADAISTLSPNNGSGSHGLSSDRRTGSGEALMMEPCYPTPSLLHLISASDEKKKANITTANLKNVPHTSPILEAEPPGTPPPLLSSINNFNMMNESIQEPSIAPPSIQNIKIADEMDIDESTRQHLSILSSTVPQARSSKNMSKKMSEKDEFELEMNRKLLGPVVGVRSMSDSLIKKRKTESAVGGGGGVDRTGKIVSSEGDAVKGSKSRRETAFGSGARKRRRELQVNMSDSLNSFAVTNTLSPQENISHQ
jgi:hypothetical protein